MFLVNATTFISFLWSIAKRFIDPNTVRKMSLSSKSSPKELHELINVNQLEAKFGGLAPPPTAFWLFT